MIFHNMIIPFVGPSNMAFLQNQNRSSRLQDIQNLRWQDSLERPIKINFIFSWILLSKYYLDWKIGKSEEQWERIFTLLSIYSDSLWCMDLKYINQNELGWFFENFKTCSDFDKLFFVLKIIKNQVQILYF
jgi:hypothetical protein